MSKQYVAFISYKHADLDIKTAKLVQHYLERYRIPPNVAKEIGKKRIGSVFRDKEEIAATADLNEDIREALRNSEYLIVICSHNTAASSWVGKEIETFLETHDRMHIVTVLADGEPNEVIPQMLREKVKEKTQVDGTVERETVLMEPLSCDCRGNRRIVRREELPRLAAVVIGCPYTDLRQRMRIYKLQRLAVAACLAVIAVGAFAGYAINRANKIAEQADTIRLQAQDLEVQNQELVQQAQEILEQDLENQISRSRYLASVSTELLESGDRYRAIEVAMEALPEGNEDDSKPLVTEALNALQNALYTYRCPRFNVFYQTGTLEAGTLSNEDMVCEISPNGDTLLIVDSAGEVTVYDRSTNYKVIQTNPEILLGKECSGDSILYARYCSDSDILLFSEHKIMKWNYQADRVEWISSYFCENKYTGQKCEAEVYSHTFAVTECVQDRFAVVFCELERTVINWLSLENGNPSESYILIENGPEIFDCSGALRVCISENGEQLAVGITPLAMLAGQSEESSYLWTIDLVSGQVTSRTTEGGIRELYYSNGLLYAMASEIPFINDLGQQLQYTVSCYDSIIGPMLWQMTGSYESISSFQEMWLEIPASMSMAAVIPEGADAERECLVVQAGKQITLYDGLSGEELQGCSLPADVLTWCVWNTNRIFAVTARGQMFQYVTTGNGCYEMSEALTDSVKAMWAENGDTFYLFPYDSSESIVMENNVGTDMLETVDLEIGSGHIDTCEYLSYEDSKGEHLLLIVKVYSQNGQSCTWHILNGETNEYLSKISVGSYAAALGITESADGASQELWVLRDSKYLSGFDPMTGRKLEDIDCTDYLTATMFTVAEIQGDTILLTSNKELATVDLKTREITSVGSGSNLSRAIMSENRERVAQLVTKYDDNDLSSTGNYCIEVMDLKTKKSTSIELQKTDDLYITAMAISPDGGQLICANGTDSGTYRTYQIYDATSGSLLGSMPVSCNEKASCCYINDHIAIVLGDNGHLTSVDTNTGEVLCEDVYTFTAGVQMVKDEEWLRVTVNGYADTYIYEVNDDGIFCRYFTATRAEVDIKNGKVAMTTDGTELAVCPIFSLDELREMATEVLDGRSLTAAERRKYFIDS